MTSARIPRLWGTILLTIAIFSLSLPTYAKYSGGTGDSNDPYQITTFEDLMLLGESSADYDKHFILTADIDLDPNLPGHKVFNKAVIAPDTSGANDSFQGIPFTGVFDGNGHTVSHLMIRGVSYLGFVGQLASGAQIRDLGIVDGDVDGSGCYVGGLVGDNVGTVIQCYSTGVVNDSKNDTGLTAYDKVTMPRYVIAGFVIDRPYAIGGLVGLNRGTIRQCCSSGTIGGARWWIGGLVGNNAGTVIQCYSTATVKGNWSLGGNWGVGGLAGYNGKDGVVKQCCSTGAVRGNWYVGGIVGENRGPVSHCYSRGSVSGVFEVGGLVGGNYSSGTVTQCYSTGAVSDTESVGGLVGHGNPESVTNSVWDMNTSVQSESAGGVGLTTTEMMDPYMLGLNGFANDPNWVLNDGNDYPRLVWEETPGEMIPIPDLDWLEGSGTSTNPYQLDMGAQLSMLRRAGALWNEHFVLRSDIDLDPKLPDGEVFQQAVIPVFRGVFDGQGHTISHLTITGGNYLGLFGQLTSGAEVRNLGVVDANIIGSGDYPVGGLVGYNYGYVTQCYTSGLVVSDSSYVGGLVGYNMGPVNHCYSRCVVSGAVTGGLAGYNYGNVIRCYCTGAVSGQNQAGGLVGDGTATSSFWDIQTSGQVTSTGGTGKTTAEMQMTSTFLIWGTCGGEGIWTIDEGKDYPRLWWENRPGESIRMPELPELLLGSGTENDPFLIYTPEELNTVGLFPCEWDKHFKLMADIDLLAFDGEEGRPTFNIIGENGENAFTGVFDGNSHVISHLTIKGTDYVGLFGILQSGSEVRDLGIVDVNVVGAGFLIGGLVGENTGSIRRCYSTGTVSGEFNVGGLVGGNRGSIANSYSRVAVTANEPVGGLVGYDDGGTIATSYSTGSVTASGQRVGGLVGEEYFSSRLVPPPPNPALTTTIGCFWDIQTSGQPNSDGGTGKTTIEMQRADTFLEAGWDFVAETGNGTDDIWWILEGQDYPRLWWETAEE